MNKKELFENYQNCKISDDYIRSNTEYTNIPNFREELINAGYTLPSWTNLLSDEENKKLVDDIAELLKEATRGQSPIALP